MLLKTASWKLAATKTRRAVLADEARAARRVSTLRSGAGRSIMPQSQDRRPGAMWMDEVENLFINVDRAKDFMNAFVDPVDREILWTAYATIIFRMAPPAPDRPFDVLFLTRVLAEMLKERDRLRLVLS